MRRVKGSSMKYNKNPISIKLAPKHQEILRLLKFLADNLGLSVSRPNEQFISLRLDSQKKRLDSQKKNRSQDVMVYDMYSNILIAYLSKKDYENELLAKLPDGDDKKILQGLQLTNKESLSISQAQQIQKIKKSENFIKCLKNSVKKEVPIGSSLSEKATSLLANNRGLALLNAHDDTLSWELFSSILKDQKIKYFFVEFDANSGHVMFELFNKTKDAAVLRKTLELKDTSVPNFANDFTKLAIILAEQGVQLVPVGGTSSISRDSSQEEVEQWIEMENTLITANILNYLEQAPDKAAKFVTILGASHYEIAKPLNIPAIYAASTDADERFRNDDKTYQEVVKAACSASVIILPPKADSSFNQCYNFFAPIAAGIAATVSLGVMAYTMSQK